MPKYDYKEVEKKWQEYWQKEGVYAFDSSSGAEVYAIDTPPPTVSGKLHLGHVFSYTQTEIIARFFRMIGENVYYPFGMDDNGLPTERLVEQDLGIRGRECGRQEFVKKCLEVVDGYHQKYRSLWQSLGFSVDWQMEYSTISPEVQKLTQQNFVDFLKRNLIYRAKVPALWCWSCQTAIAAAEVDDLEREGIFFDLKFSDESGKEIIVATTRPELLPAIVGAFVNPNDKRYSHLVGQKITTPLGDRVEVRADFRVAIDKGSGLVMCCTYGDETDLAWKREYGLPERVILTKDGRFEGVDNPTEINGLTIREGREVIVEKLEKLGAIKVKKEIRHEVGCHERCGTPIEIVPTDQWFVKVLDIKTELLAMVEEVNWYPKMMKQRMVAWIENLKWDWAISRDRFFGIPIPIWYCPDCGETMVAKSEELPVDPLFEKQQRKCPKCGFEKLVPEKLVLDTWFTSGNTPEINMVVNKEKTGGKITTPMALRPQAHDIIRTWAFYTLVMSHYKNGQIPWKDVAISGHILLKKGEKISKRTGGGNMRPEEQIAIHSADAVRYAMCGAALGVDAYYDEQELTAGKKFITKMVNAASFGFGLMGELTTQPDERDITWDIDKAMRTRATETAAKMRGYFENYDYAHAREQLSKFFWTDFCDYYIELVKRRGYEKVDSAGRRSAWATLYWTIYDWLRMAAPFVPHVTEELYQTYFRESLVDAAKSIHLASWPEGKEEKEDKKLEGLWQAIARIRIEKTSKGIGLGEGVLEVVVYGPVKDWVQDQLTYDLGGVAKADKVVIKEADQWQIIIEK